MINALLVYEIFGWVGIVYIHIIAEINEIPKLTSEWVSD